MIPFCVFLDCLKYVAIILNFSTLYRLYHVNWLFLFGEAFTLSTEDVSLKEIACIWWHGDVE